MTIDLLAIVEKYTNLKRESRTKGGEYQGPCPFCAGNDRFHVWPGDDYPHYWCRGCGAWGGVAKFLHEKEGVSWHAAIAAEREGIDPEETEKHGHAYKPSTTPADVAGAPCVEWQIGAKVFCNHARRLLWSEEAAAARTWLQGGERGFTEEWLKRSLYGFNPKPLYLDLDEWGMTPTRDLKKLWIPRGIVIPYYSEDQLWQIKIRRDSNNPREKYAAVSGGSNALYGAETLAYGKPAILVESEFDVDILHMLLPADASLGTVATGSTNGAREQRWIMKLALCELVLVAFDPDEAGDKRATWWLERLPNAVRWSPAYGDITKLHVEGYDVLDWLNRGIEYARSIKPAATPIVVTEIPEGGAGQCLCCIEEATHIDLHSRPWCAEHAPVGAVDRLGISNDPTGKRLEPDGPSCWLCGAEIDLYDLHGRPWCNEHAPEKLQMSPEKLAEWRAPLLEANPIEGLIEESPLPVRNLREPDRCSNVNCRRQAAPEGYDLFGHPWCDLCFTRRDLFDTGYEESFPRVNVVTTTWIRKGEEGWFFFASQQSRSLVTMALSEMRR